MAVFYGWPLPLPYRPTAWSSGLSGRMAYLVVVPCRQGVMSYGRCSRSGMTGYESPEPLVESRVGRGMALCGFPRAFPRP